MGGTGEYEGEQWVGRSHESDQPGVIHYSLRWLSGEAASHGLKVQLMPYPVYHRQYWLRFTAPDAAPYCAGRRRRRWPRPSLRSVSGCAAANQVRDDRRVRQQRPDLEQARAFGELPQLGDEQQRGRETVSHSPQRRSRTTAVCLGRLRAPRSDATIPKSVVWPGPTLEIFSLRLCTQLDCGFSPSFRTNLVTSAAQFVCGWVMRTMPIASRARALQERSAAIPGQQTVAAIACWRLVRHARILSCGAAGANLPCCAWLLARR